MPALAVVGDVHGALHELFDVLEHVAQVHGPIAGVLQAGDLGVFGYESVLDKATKRFVADDPTELGIAPYIAGERDPVLPVWFTRGNHEDFALLQRSGDSIDPFGQIQHLPDATVTDVLGVRVLAIGGIEGEFPEKGGQRGGKFLRKDDVDEAAILCTDAQVLLTHPGPQGYCVEGNTLAGSWALLGLVDAVKPRWHFFGHHGHPPRPAQRGDTWIVPLNQPDVLKVPNRDGGIGLLDCQTLEFVFVMPDFSVCPVDALPHRT